MKKKLIALTLVSVLLLAQTASAATMYALDGRTLEVNDNEIEAYRQVNWYYGKPVTMYALDGRTLTVGENDVEMYRQVGWYYGKPVTMYALDGRTLTVGENDVEMYRQVGWYTEPVQTLYTLDGRSQHFLASEVAAQLNVGWYKYPVTTMYALDGRQAVVSKDEVKAWKAVGWFESGDTWTMYTPDGRSETIPYYEIPAWQKVGWYMVPVQTLYTADGRSAVFPKSEVSAQLTVGWYTTKPSYKTAYASVLRNILSDGVKSGASFALVHINNDNIPELVYHKRDTNNAGATVYTYHNGKAVQLGNFSSEDIFFRKKGNLFIAHFAGMGIEAIEVYKISNGKAVKLCELQSDNSDNPYKVNGQSVSRSYYLNTASNYYFASRVNGYFSLGNYSATKDQEKFALNSTNIRAVFE